MALLTEVISTGIRYSPLPESYIRPVSDRPGLSEVSDCENIPVIDLGCGDGSLILQEISKACTLWGFFQVRNHGISMEDIDIEKMQVAANEFFSLPVEEKMKLHSDDPSKTMRLSTSFNVKKETVHNWRDYLRLHCYPLEQYVPEWPSNPSSFKEIVSNYHKEVQELGLRLLEAIYESLGLEKDCIKNALGEQGQHLAVNYYPPCPEPELTYGLPGHTDPNAPTILLQDLNVSGLQVLKDGKWLAAKPHANAFVINIGDQSQDDAFGFCRFSQTSDDQGGRIVKWNTSSWKRVSSKHIVRDPVSTLNVSADGKLLVMALVSVSLDSSARVTIINDDKKSDVQEKPNEKWLLWLFYLWLEKLDWLITYYFVLAAIFLYLLPHLNMDVVISVIILLFGLLEYKLY